MGWNLPSSKVSKNSKLSSLSFMFLSAPLQSRSLHDSNSMIYHMITKMAGCFWNSNFFPGKTTLYFIVPYWVLYQVKLLYNRVNYLMKFCFMCGIGTWPMLALKETNIYFYQKIICDFRKFGYSSLWGLKSSWSRSIVAQ